jgi:hypothetical protein
MQLLALVMVAAMGCLISCASDAAISPNVLTRFSVCQIRLELSQPFTLLLRTLAILNVGRRTNFSETIGGYTQDGDGFAIREMKIGDLPVVEYTERVFSDITIGLEELVMYALQGQCKGSLMIDEIPLGTRDPQNPQRFKRNMKGMGTAWELKWSGKGFYES